MSEPMTTVPVPAAMPSLDAIVFEIVSHSSKPYGEKAASNAARAILDLFAPILAEKEREKEAAIQVAEMNATAGAFWAERGKAAEARALAAEAALAGERERTVRDTLLHVRNLLAANQVPLGKDFEDVWNTNARELYES